MLLMQLGLVCASGLHAQVQTLVPAVVPGAKPAKVEQITVHGTSLEGNLEGDAVDRPVIVYLPPSYSTDKRRRYPVVYALHGYSIGAEQWSKEIHVPQTIEGAFAQGAQEMIVVLPDSKTVHNGSMYSSSMTTGDFEQFIAKDVVAYIDGHYRTIPNRASRGLVGHSMGGYGAARIGMKHADIFGSLYIMSPCCLSARKIGPAASELEKAVHNMKTPPDSSSLPFGTRAQLASAAAWSPNPKNPPLYLDLPVKDGEPQPDILAKWAANAPSLLSTNISTTCVGIRPSRSTSATRTVSRSMPPSFTKYSIYMVCKTPSRSTREPIRVRWPIAFRIMSCRFSARTSASRQLAMAIDAAPFRDIQQALFPLEKATHGNAE
jgi:pimeloyl-ACP methyl ester carboxylesterase